MKRMVRVLLFVALTGLGLWLVYNVAFRLGESAATL